MEFARRAGWQPHGRLQGEFGLLASRSASADATGEEKTLVEMPHLSAHRATLLWPLWGALQTPHLGPSQPPGSRDKAAPLIGCGVLRERLMD